MQIFTLEEVKPSDYTLHIIKQIAYSYKVKKQNGRQELFCLS